MGSCFQRYIGTHGNHRFDRPGILPQIPTTTSLPSVAFVDEWIMKHTRRKSFWGETAAPPDRQAWNE